MSVSPISAVWVLAAVVVAGDVAGVEAQVTPWPLAFVDGPNVAAPAEPAVPAQAAATAQPAVPQQAVPTPAPAPPGSRSTVPPNPLMPRTSRLTGLSAILVTGDTEEASTSRGGAPSLEVPAAARKALASISSFLPYKSYSMADAALVSTNVNQVSVVLMRDPELIPTLLRLQLAANASPPMVASESYSVNVSLNELSTGKPEDKTGRQLISTNVTLALGETVVVGTSRIGGGRKAYVLLLTAIGK